jgi:hypothetical protein
MEASEIIVLNQCKMDMLDNSRYRDTYNSDD